MRLELSEAISLILALPAHRSHNEGHRKMGDKTLELLFEYKELAENDTEKSFNLAMMSSVLSTVRAFSVERDRIGVEWAAIAAIKEQRKRYIEVIRNLSPLEKGNYWSRTISLIIAAGFTIKLPPAEIDFASGIWTLVAILIGLEIVSKVAEVGFSALFEKRLPIEKEAKWNNESMKRYRTLIHKFIEEAIGHYKRYYPSETKLYGYDITQEEEKEKCKEYLLNLHTYF